MLLTPTYHVMEMYAVHQDAVLLPVRLESARYVMGGDSLPALSVSASRDREGLMHISLVNIDAVKAQEVVIQVAGAGVRSVRARLLASGRIQDHNTFEAPETVKPAPFTGARAGNGEIRLTMPPCSVVVLEARP